MHVLFFLCGFVAVAFVLVITLYLIVSGLPAIREVGLVDFLFGTTWDSTNKTNPQYGILPFILTSIYGTAGAILIGVPLGIASATHKNSPLDHGARIFSMLGATMPVFWFGLMLILIFYATLHWTVAPTGRISMGINPPTTITGMYVLDSILTGDMVALKDSLAHIILPAITLSMSTMAVMARMTRASMLEVLGQDYIRTARAKGMKERIVIYRHALRNALIPILTVLGGQFGMMLGYTVVVETIFSWPGSGFYVTDAILNVDYNPVQAFALFSALLYVVINLVLDILYTVVDRRVKYD